MTTATFSSLVLSILISSSLGLQCRDENNKPVDWYVLLKVPKLDTPYLIPDVRKGRGYMYMTSETLDTGWVISKNSIFNNNTAAAFSLAPYYKNNNSDLWLFYNDQPPGMRSKSRGGHTKGVVGADKGGGFWMVHSVPHFPAQGPKFAYPATGVKYGQSFICLSLTPLQLDSLGSNVLRYNTPHFYESRFSQGLQIDYPNLYKAASGFPVTDPPYMKKTSFSTVQSSKFLAFAKAKKFGKDLYEWVANELDVDVLTETWLNEEGAMPSLCNSSHNVLNIESISYKGITFNSSHDHSKWAISTKKEKPWVCIGDINRAIPQEKRGGGTVCLENVKLWENYKALTQNIQPCPKKKHKYTQHNISIKRVD